MTSNVRIAAVAVAILAGGIISLTLILGVPNLAPAHGPFHGHGEGPCAMGGPEGPDGDFFPMPPYLHGMDLTDAQRDRLFAMFHAQMPAQRELGKAMAKARAELFKMSVSEQYDDAKAKTLAQTLAGQLAERERQHAQLDNQVYRLLTAEQRAQLAENVKMMEAGPRGGKGPKGEPGK